MNNKIKILIASVLKPADDVRSCHKVGQSLAQTNKYDVHIIGFDSKKNVEKQNISLHPIFKFGRTSFKRLLAPISIFKNYIKLKPDIIIVNTPELLPVIILIRIIFGTKIIYDIQENYRYNIKYSRVYRGIIKSIALLYIKLIENISKHFVDGYFLAEAIYAEQLSFLRKKPNIKLLNKSILPIREKIQPIEFSNDQSIRFVYSGTIGMEYGTLEAIEFVKNLHKINNKITLTIIGYSADNQYIELVRNKVKAYDFIRLMTDHKPIPQSEIINEIKRSDIALLPYLLNPNISGRFPTKIYDYLALGIPMIMSPQPQWMAYIDTYHAGLALDFTKPDLQQLIANLTTTTFYIKSPKEEIQWKGQEAMLLKFMDKL